MDDLTPKLHYHTWLYNPEPACTPCVDAQKLADCLPHGSGIDGDWNIDVNRHGDLVVYGEYHAMNEGGYCGWVSFRFRIGRATKNEYHALSGPSAGKYQVTRRKGVVYLLSLTGGGAEHGDYLYDTVAPVLADELGVHSIGSDIVGSEEEARKL